MENFKKEFENKDTHTELSNMADKYILDKNENSKFKFLLNKYAKENYDDGSEDGSYGEYCIL